MSNIYSRREFLRGAAVGAVGVAGLGLLSAVAGAAEGEASSEGGASEGGAPSGGPGFGAVPASDPYDGPDPVAGTDDKGNTVYYSMRRNWVGEPPVVYEDEIAGEYTADVVIIGANYSGSACFRMACEKGATCIVIDSQYEDSFSSFGGQLGHFNSTWQEEVLGIPKSTFDPVDFINAYQLQSSGRVQPDLLRKFAHRNGEIVDWLFELYEDTSAITNVTMVNENWQDYYDWSQGGHFWTYPACANLGSGNMGSSANYNLEMVKAGIAANPESRAFYAMDALVLIKNGDTVCGVITEDENGKRFRIMARKAVVLATGDFSSNADMYSALCTENQECNPYTRIVGSGRNGYGHRMGVWAGAVMELGPRAGMGGATAPPMGTFSATGGLWVNTFGNRFCNETFGSPFVAACQAARQPIGSNVTLVFDQGHWRDMVKNSSVGHFNVSNLTEAALDNYEETLAAAKEAGAEGVRGLYCADTLEELAAYAGFEGEAAENFVAAVKRYNEFAAAGRDEDYGKAAATMFRISEPPYYANVASRNAHMVLVTLTGLFIDGNGQCVDQSFMPIPGLFAVGNASGGRFPLQYTAPMNGISIGMACVLGALTGEYLGESAPVVSTGESESAAMGTELR